MLGGRELMLPQPTPPSFAEETVARLAQIDKKLHNALHAKQVRYVTALPGRGLCPYARARK
jgi:hypothetical protein